MTLIETLAGLALLGSILVGVLLTKSRQMHQWQLANRRIEAVKVADQLLTQWWPDRLHLPRSGSGSVPARAGEAHGFEWRTTIVGNPSLKDWDVQMVRLEIREELAQSETTPLASVDVMVPDEKFSQPGPGHEP